MGGTLPSRARRIEAPTPYVWIVARIQCDGERDYAHVNDFQDRLSITPFAQGERAPERRLPRSIRPAVDEVTPPPEQVAAMSPGTYFCYAAELLKLHPPHPTDHAVLQRLERLGFVIGESLNVDALPRAVVESLRPAMVESRLRRHDRERQLGWSSNGWRMNTGTMGAWGTDYLRRASVDRIALGALLPEDVVDPTANVDGDGDELLGSRRYSLRFEPHELPPARAFWSLTAYDEEGYVQPNGTGRCSLRERDDLVFEPDGALELAIQVSAPLEGPLANWLPCPEGAFSLCLRLYWPETAGLDRSWAPPPVRFLGAL